ncbi:MAG: hypothetical protein M1829_003630 [Trizodia sp. TS-e1964]|nr:MAG: hypothetical protein M1829_003630 [Trizodia sp. TS-e1964]
MATPSRRRDLSPTTQARRDKLIRELSQDLENTPRPASPNLSQFTATPDNTMGSLTSGIASTEGSVHSSHLSDFDPENEAQFSTRPLIDAEAVPDYDTEPSTRPAVNPRAGRSEPLVAENGRQFKGYLMGDSGFAIDSAAIANIFNDYSDNSNLSIELPRGKYPEEIDDSIRSEAQIGKYQVIYTPPVIEGRPNRNNKATRASSASAAARRDILLAKENTRNVSPPGVTQRGTFSSKDSVPTIPPATHTRPEASRGKENAPPSPPLSGKGSDYASGSSRPGSGGQARPRAPLQARVRDENDKSFMSADSSHSPAITIPKTRVNSKNAIQTIEPSTPKRPLFPARPAQHQFHEDSEISHTPLNTPNVTVQPSFVLPDLPNINELVSGAYRNGSPIFSRHVKSPSRFASTPTPRSPSKAARKFEHAPIDNLPISSEDRAIFLSLQILQDKVIELEKRDATREDILACLKNENVRLKLDLKQQKARINSAAGFEERGGEGTGQLGGSRANLIAQIAKLDSNNKSLQASLDSAKNQVLMAEASVENIKHDRDAAVTQLGVAYYTAEELRTENDALKKALEARTDEVNNLKIQLGHLTAAHREEIKKWNKKELSLQKKLDRREEALKDVTEMTRDFWDLKQNPTQVGKTTDKGKQPARGGPSEITHILPAKDETESKKKAPNGTTTKPSVATARPVSRGNTTRSINVHENTIQEPVREPILASLNELSDSEGSDAGFTNGQPTHTLEKGPLGYNNATTEITRSASVDDSTSSSIENPGLTALRELVNRERATREERINNEAQETASKEEAVDKHSEFNETSDFRFAGPLNFNFADRVKPRLNLFGDTIATQPESARPYRDNSRKQDIKKDKPATIPAKPAQRIPEYEFNDDPTIRPSEPPGVALASVMKGLQDELAVLKQRASKYQAMYDSHDPELSKRRRKAVLEKITSLLQLVDTKADQIYSLHDVVLAQESAGIEVISQEQAEVTLQSIGIDIFNVGGRQNTGTSSRSAPRRQSAEF